MRILLIIFSLFLTHSTFSQDAYKSFIPKHEFKNTLPPSFKLLLWNVHKGENGEQWKNDFSMLLSQYDILTLQEVLLNPLMTDVFNGVTEHQAHMAISFYYKNQGETGVATVSRFLPVDIQAQKSPELEFWFKTPKTSMITSYQIEGSQKRLLVINTHALNYDWGSRYQKHLQSLATLIQKHDGPVIWSGDFNTWSDHREKICSNVVSSLGLKQVQFKEDKRSTFMFGHVVDQVFVKGLDATGAKVLESIQSSDHKPISVEFTLK